MASRLNGYLPPILTAFLVAFLVCVNTAFADHKTDQRPVVITDQDLNSLSPEARRELQALIQHKQENPDPKPTRIRFGKNRGIVDGDIGPGGVDIQLLGGAIQIGGKNRRRLPQPVAKYVPESDDLFPSDLIITMVKRGREPMFITVEKGAIRFTIPAEKLEEMIDKYKPYVMQMLQNGMNNSGESFTPEAPDSSPSIDLGAPATNLGEPGELPGPDLGNPAPLPPDPMPEKD
ncbi:MAG: hypothetical protein P8M30_00890 [Planctomycetaceae bacterium]|nr:hypothetical protein [bacterium]MDG2387850.1 hypothetical protein [Planctomycetaceae bacterium]